MRYSRIKIFFSGWVIVFKSFLQVLEAFSKLVEEVKGYLLTGSAVEKKKADRIVFRPPNHFILRNKCVTYTANAVILCIFYIQWLNTPVHARQHMIFIHSNAHLVRSKRCDVYLDTCSILQKISYNFKFVGSCWMVKSSRPQKKFLHTNLVSNISH